MADNPGWVLIIVTDWLLLLVLPTRAERYGFKLSGLHRIPEMPEKSRRGDQMDAQGPGWPSAAVALGFLASITIIFVTVYQRDGIDAAIKAWGLVGTLVGVVIGAIPAYFFRQAAEKAQDDAKKLMQAADENTIQRARALGFKG
jgi:hypothetical protein